MFHGQSQWQHDMAKKALASKTGEVKYLQQGPVGPLVYPTGEYAASVSYTRTPLSAPMVLCEGQYYVLNKEGTFKNINPKKDYAANGSKATWVLMDKVRYSFVEILMANFAKLASAVFYGQYMFSQYGVRADGSAVETEGGYKDFNYSDPMNPANGFRPNLLIDFLRGSLYGRSVDLQGDITAETMNLKVCTNSDNELPNGSIILYPKNLGPLPELEAGTCQEMKMLFPIATRVPLSVTLTTASANVRIAPNGSILDSASSYDIVDAYGYHELIGFRYADGDITYWCVFKKQKSV